MGIFIINIAIPWLIPNNLLNITTIPAKPLLSKSAGAKKPLIPMAHIIIPIIINNYCPTLFSKKSTCHSPPWIYIPN